jgi:pimeloyl-ACP methyl ester carboxylesterase
MKARWLILLLLLQCCTTEKDKTEVSNPKDMATKVKTMENGIQGVEGFLYITDEGKGNIVPIVFAHSFGGSSAHWKNQIDYFRNKNRVIAFDFRSHGKSDPSTQQLFSAEALATDIAAVIDSLGLEEFILVGHSMGGAAAIAYASAYPDRVAGLLLAGTPGKTPKEQSTPVIASLESDKYDEVMDQYMKSLLADAKPETNTLVMGEIKKISKETSINIIKALFEFDPIPAMKEFQMPLLIVSTAREKSQPNSLMNQMPEVNNQVFQGTSHWIQLDKPLEFNRILDRFISEVEQYSASQKH